MSSVLLVRPETPEHTGFIARLADNFEFDLKIVNPGFNLSEARKTANNGQKKLREAEIFENVEEAVKQLGPVIGTKPGCEPLSSCKLSSEYSVMIGPESSGLKNIDLELCDLNVEIDTPGYSSLPQSHAAGIMMHAVSRGSEHKRERNLEGLKSRLPEEVFETVLRADPTQEEIGRIIAEFESD